MLFITLLMIYFLLIFIYWLFLVTSLLLLLCIHLCTAAAVILDWLLLTILLLVFVCINDRNEKQIEAIYLEGHNSLSNTFCCQCNCILCHLSDCSIIYLDTLCSAGPWFGCRTYEYWQFLPASTTIPFTNIFLVEHNGSVTTT